MNTKYFGKASKQASQALESRVSHTWNVRSSGMGVCVCEGWRRGGGRSSSVNRHFSKWVSIATTHIPGVAVSIVPTTLSTVPRREHLVDATLVCVACHNRLGGLNEVVLGVDGTVVENHAVHLGAVQAPVRQRDEPHLRVLEELNNEERY